MICRFLLSSTLGKKESKLLWHLKRAWYTFSVRFMQGLPISISMEGDERDVRRLYSEVEDEILECTIHGNISNSQDCGSLLAELSEALLQDRQVKSLFFDSGRLLRFLLKNLALLQANDPKIARVPVAISHRDADNLTCCTLQQRNIR